MKSFILAGLLVSVPLWATTPTGVLNEHAQVLKSFAEGVHMTTNIAQLDQMGLSAAMLSESTRPWSGSYWADRAGSIAVRYRKSNLNEQLRILWGTNNSHRKFEREIEKLQAELNTLEEKDVAGLSAAEKYDILMGDRNFTFTKQLWERILATKEHWGHVTMWTGICHGWAPAAIHLPRPTKSVRLTSPSGKIVTFYPDDVKALGSYLWAHKANDVEQMFAGNRCNQKNPPIDMETGTPELLRNYSRSANECSDVDPVVFHVITAHRIGRLKRSYVVDVDYNAPVNNHPVVGYEVRYFHPVNDALGEFKQSIAGIGFQDDVLKSKRHPQAKFAVGVEMILHLSDWKLPDPAETDSPSKDKITTRTIRYQIDMDPYGNPLKGHWRINPEEVPVYPDFMWNDPTGFRPTEFFTAMSAHLPMNLTRAPLTREWTEASVKSSENMLKLAPGTRIGHRLAKREKLYEEVERRAKDDNTTMWNAASDYEVRLDAIGVPTHRANPQPLSRVVMELFRLSSQP